MDADARAIAIARKVKAQRRQIRQLNKALHLRDLMWREMLTRWQNEHDQRLADRSQYYKAPLDYRSVCCCWLCRFRGWYRLRAGITYPGERNQWRFPGARLKGGATYWPDWR